MYLYDKRDFNILNVEHINIMYNITFHSIHLKYEYDII